MRGVNDSSMETISAAATAIVTAEARVQQATVQKRRWGGCWSGYWCFGSHRNGKRIGHAVLVPEPMMPGTSAAPASEIPTRPPSVILPFAAPPSSPASFLQSEPHSSTQSPAGLLSFTNFSANAYSPGPNSIFAIGPYAHETQLVSPPVFSTFTTEPSTAPFTPPPEPVHLTTPSSPEVPFAQLLTSSLDPNHRNSESGRKFPLSHYEFQSYQLYPGSPVGHLISPSSVRSGASSPFPDCDFNSGGRTFLEFHTGDVPKLWNITGLSTSKWVTRQSSGSLTPDPAGPTSHDREFHLENQISEVASLANSEHGSEINDMTINHRVSFELNAGEVASCLEKELGAPVKAISESLPAKVTTTERDGLPNQMENFGETSGDLPEKASGDGEEEQQCIEQPSSLTTVGSVKEFKFDNTDGGTSDKPAVNSDWWANENVVAKEAGPHNNWAFFPMMQPGVS
ncbi:hypothetical protein BVC80_1787g66 [Macleaya cordata]|uniref:Hydroxyproline-rich glycoprotein family protein n=1 Tax=Macleaya cordata TaxID=56857 RepID=A0A200QU81_MACCD|nr:hypothetical protein BVC80_1787g66 [Macleaya cordata]